MRCILPMEYQWNKCYSIGTNRTNGRLECTPTQPEANGNILSSRNEMRFTNGKPMNWVLFHWRLFVCIGQWSPANIKGADKDAKIYIGRSTTVHNLLFCAHTVCMSYVPSTFLLVGSSVQNKQLLSFVKGKNNRTTEQQHTTKNFDEFHNHSPLLTIG